MNEQTEKLIRELAGKLGTTTEHPWDVLIRQAWISGITNLIVILAWCAFLVWSYRLVCKKTHTPPETEEEKYPHAEWPEEAAFVAWTVWATAVILVVAVCGTAIEGVVGSLANPEYWALKQIIK